MNRVVRWSGVEGSTWVEGFDANGLRTCIMRPFSNGSAYLGEDKYESVDAAKRAAERGTTTESKGERNVLKEITSDLKGFMHDNRNVIYWLAVAFLIDHFFLNGSFRQRLSNAVEKIIGKVEKQIES